MDIASFIRRAAHEIVEAAQNRAAALEREMDSGEAYDARVKAQLEAAHLARKRLANFMVQIGPDYQCPRCWIEDEARSTLRGIPSENRNEDWLACSARDCGYRVPLF